MSNKTRAERATVGGCVREGLISEAQAKGRAFRSAVRRGDFRSAEHAWDSADHQVGYPYMTQSEYTAARAAFVAAVK